MEEEGSWVVGCCGCGEADTPPGGAGGERCGQPGADADSTDSAFRSVSRALENLQAVIGQLDAKVEVTWNVLQGVKQRMRAKRRRVDGLQRRMDNVERRLAFDPSLKDSFGPFADCVPMRVPPPHFPCMSTSTSDLPSSGSEALDGGSSLTDLGSPLSPGSVHAPVSIAISMRKSSSDTGNRDLRDSTLILRFIPVSTSISTNRAVSDATHEDTVLPLTRPDRIDASLTEKSSRTCGKATSTDKFLSTSTVSVSMSCHCHHSDHKTHSPTSGPEANSNSVTKSVPESKSLHDQKSISRSTSTLKLSTASNITSIHEPKSASTSNHIPNVVPSKTSVKKRASNDKFSSTSPKEVSVTTLFSSSCNLNAVTSHGNLPLVRTITPTFIPAGASDSPGPVVPIPSSISWSSRTSSSSLTLVARNSSSFLRGMALPSGCRSLLVQTVSSTVRPLTAHSSRVLSDASETAPAAAAQRVSDPPTSSGDDADPVRAVQYIALPHVQRSACAQTAHAPDARVETKSAAAGQQRIVWQEASVGVAGVPNAPAPTRRQSSAGQEASLGVAVDRTALAPTRRQPSTGQEASLGVAVNRTVPAPTRRQPIAWQEASPGACAAKAAASDQLVRSLPDTSAVATTVSSDACIPVSASCKFASWTHPDFRLLAGRTTTLLGKELLKAAYEGRSVDVDMILRSGIHVDYTCGSTWTPLHRASWGGHAGVVALLLHRGADVHAVTAFGFTALHIAAYNDPGGECVRLLIAAGAEVEARNRLGWTPLHYAAEGGRSAAVSALVHAGASAVARSDRGKTPLHVARTRSIRQLLLRGQHEALIQEEDNQDIGEM